MQIINDRDFADFIGRQESQFTRTHDQWRDSLLELIDNDGGVAHLGFALPWNHTHNAYRVRPKEVTVWAGVGGCGKSLITGQIALDAVTRGQKVMIASLEMPGERTLYRMARQFAGCEKPNRQQFDRFMALPDLWLYDQTGMVSMERVLAAIHYAGAALGVDQVIFDCMTKVGLIENEHQERFLDGLTWLAKSHGMHVHLVHHLRKGADINTVPNGFDLRGASQIRDLADNVVLMWKNAKKIADRNEGMPVDEKEPDGVLIVDKQRHHDWTGRIPLFYHHPSMQFIEKPFNNFVRQYA